MPYVSQADLGGQGGFGPIRPDADDALFHGEWESRVLALTLAMGATGCWNLDMSRSARETLPDYRDISYYRIWLAALEKLLVANGLVSGEELAAGRALAPAAAIPRVLRAERVDAVLSRGAPTRRESHGTARFRCGERVRTRSLPVAHHTRLPGYLRGKTGVIERIHGVHVFADSHAQGLGENPEWLYTVVFEAPQVWGPGADAGDSVSFEAWQPYLERA